MEDYLKDKEFKELLSAFIYYLELNPDIIKDEEIIKKYIHQRKTNSIQYDYYFKYNNSTFAMDVSQKVSEYINMSSDKENNNTLAISIIKYDGKEDNYKDVLTECTIIFDRINNKLVDVADYEIYDKNKKSR